MRHINAVTLFTQIFVQFIGNKNAAVLSACAAYADNKLCLAFVNILRYKKIKQLLLQLQILEGLRIAADKIRYRRSLPVILRSSST